MDSVHTRWTTTVGRCLVDQTEQMAAGLIGVGRTAAMNHRSSTRSYGKEEGVARELTHNRIRKRGGSVGGKVGRCSDDG
jgi:hypothetical protein